MKTKQLAQWGLLLIALLSLLSPNGAVQAQEGTGEILVQKIYNMKSNYGSYTNYRLNMLMTLWGVSPGSKTQGAYKNVPDSFEGQVEITTGTTWLNGVFGPYTTEYGMGYSEVGGITEGGGACDILSMVAETLDDVNSVTVDSYSPHPSPIPGVASKYSLAVATDKNLADPRSKNGADVRVVNNYGIITLHWKVEGDTLTLWVTGGKSTSQPSVVVQQPSSDASLFAPMQKWSGWILVIVTVLLVVFFAPRAILRIGKPKTQGEVARKQDLWRGIIETEILVGIIMVTGAYLYAIAMWPDIVAHRRRLLLDWLNGASNIPNLWLVGIGLYWLTSTLLSRYRQKQIVTTTTEVKETKGKPKVFAILVVVGALLGVYFFPSLYTPPPSKASVPSGACDGSLLAKLLEGSEYKSSVPPQERQASLTAAISRITPELEAVYAEAQRQTGVPCEVLAGIHFVEANNRDNGSLISGRAIGVPEPDQGGKIYSSLLETAVDAAKVLKGKANLPKEEYAEFTSIEQLISAMSKYNGGGNRNCRDDYGYSIPYTGCPKAFDGEDDPYAVNWLDSRHSSMYLLYCADYTACQPAIFKRPGSFTVTLWFYNQVTSRR